VRNFAKPRFSKGLAGVNKQVGKGENKSMADKPSIQEYVNLLIENRNLILTGSPGTGKTFLAKQIAMEMIEAKTEKEREEKAKEQIGFVQFHPSYDYTDFVEGLRPMLPDERDENENVSFELKPGIFKDFCNKAKRFEFIQSMEIDNFDEAWDKFFKEIEGKTNYKIKSIRGIDIKVEPKESGSLQIILPSEKKLYYFSKDLCYKVYKGCYHQGGLGCYMKATINHLKEKFGLKNYLAKNDSPDGKKYIFIIDEINRGEISKIFGELFFSIDPGYRGKKGKVKTQYQNMSDDDEDFYVPENVFIIGTMNDIDRSVESFDFAMRRRFVWKEIKAEDNLEMLNELGNLKIQAKNKLIALNNVISGIEGLGSAYHIGGAYFLKLKIYTEKYSGQEFDKLWEYHLEPLLREYLRGKTNSEINTEIEKIKQAYKNDNDNR